MNTSLSSLLSLIRASLSDPRGVARHLQSLDIARGDLWQLGAAVVLMSVVAAYGTALVIPEASVMLLSMFPSPFVLALIELAMLLIIVGGAFWIGRAFGGVGSFDDCLKMVIWLQFIMVCVQVVQFVGYMILPPLAEIVSIAGLGLFFWLLVNFIAEIHGFRSLGLVFVGLVLSIFAILFGLSVLLALLGVLVPEAQAFV